MWSRSLWAPACGALLAAACILAGEAHALSRRRPAARDSEGRGETRGIAVVRAPTGEALVGQNWLLAIAINKYEEWPPLRGPRKDAGALKKVLLERYAFDASRVVELCDDKATKAGIIRTFKGLVDRLGADDSLLVYFAGHGHTDPITGGYWIPHDAGTDEDAQENWLPNVAIRGTLAALPCAHVLLVSDSCFSGDLLDRHRGRAPKINDEYYRRAYSLRSRQVITSGSSEPVSDTALGGHSAFAFHMIDTLKRNREPYLDPLTVFDRVRRGVPGQQPLMGSVPGAGHQEGGAYLFFLRKGGASAAVQPGSTGTQPGGTGSAELDAMRRELEAFRREMAEAKSGAPAPPRVETPLGRNLAVNGGFEAVDTKTKFAESWTPNQWGNAGERYSVRLDRTNVHSGDRSVVVRGLAEGAKPGVYTTLDLQPGKYEVSCWACADLGATVRVGGSLAGSGLTEKAVGEEWQQLMETVEVSEQQIGADLCIWAVGEGRAWFDDVAVVRSVPSDFTLDAAYRASRPMSEMKLLSRVRREMRKKLRERLEGLGLPAGPDDVEAVFAAGEIVDSTIEDDKASLRMRFSVKEGGDG
jgi:hypothetical protein